MGGLGKNIYFKGEVTYRLILMFAIQFEDWLPVFSFLIFIFISLFCYSEKS